MQLSRWPDYWMLLFLIIFNSEVCAVEQIDRPGNKNDPGLFSFVSRPDLISSKWTMKTHTSSPSALSPGYWLVAPFKDLGDSSDGNWEGPHIYSSVDGTLIWSGASLNPITVHEFAISNINGDNFLTYIDRAHLRGTGYIIDDHYEVRKKLDLGQGGVDGHEFNFVDGEVGTRVFALVAENLQYSEEQSRRVGFQGRCNVGTAKIVEYDAATWEKTWEWRVVDHIGLEESTIDLHVDVRDRCTSGWDYIHVNAVTALPDGTILLSSRHASTIYAISRSNSNILWRLGGTQSDFALPSLANATFADSWLFTRQHNIRYLSSNSTHTRVSLFDNAKGDDNTPPSYPFSRGLILALNIAEKTATVEAQYNHPEGAGNWAPRRGNLQILEDGNIFAGWSERGLISEHAANGTLLMEGYLSVEWMGNYRSYKFPLSKWVGKPNQPPDVVAKAFTDQSFGTKTRVWVSWNGATEVKSWEVLKAVPASAVNGSNAARKVEKTQGTDPQSEETYLLAVVSRKGFETTLDIGGYVSYLVVQAINGNGTVLGMSEIIKSAVDETVPSDEVAEELERVKSVQAMSDKETCIGESCNEKELGIPMRLRIGDYAPRGRIWISGWGAIVAGVMLTVLVGIWFRVERTRRGAIRLCSLSGW